MKIKPTKFNWNNPSEKVSAYFKVSDVTSGDSKRIPKHPLVKQRIKKLAKELDKLQNIHGNIDVNSWYRPKAINDAIGGASNSQHIQGWAADICLAGKSTRAQREFEQWLDANWKGGVGRGQAAGKGFTHVDLGPHRRWNY